jgi:hypothetical protein
MKLLLHLLTFARRQARRSSGPAADQVRAGDQPQDRQCDGHYSSPDISGTRRQGDRVARPFVALHESGIGTNAKYPNSRYSDVMR